MFILFYYFQQLFLETFFRFCEFLMRRIRYLCRTKKVVAQDIYIYIYNSIKYLNFCPLVFLTAENFHHFNGLCIMEVYVYIMAGAHSHRNTKCAEVYTSVPMNICLPKCDVLPSESLPTFQRILLAHQHGTSTRPHCTKHQNT